jgi:hypothetical protein
MLKPNGEKYKIGMSVITCFDRPEYLKITLDSLFASNLYDYDVTFLISNDGSEDQRVIDIINQPRDPKLNITRYHTPKGHNSWGASFNKAMNKLITLGDFDIVGNSDDDALYHPEWLDMTMKIAIWAKEHNKEDHLGPFSSYNSANFKFHKILAERDTPYGKYVVKERMGALNYFYFMEDFKKLGFFEESKHDETLMTERMKKLNSRNFSTSTTYVEHIGNEKDILNRWRESPVKLGDSGVNLVKEGWPMDPYQFRPAPKFYYDSLQEDYNSTITKVNRDNARPKLVRSFVSFIRLWKQRGINVSNRILNKMPFKLGLISHSLYRSVYLFFEQGSRMGLGTSISRFFLLQSYQHKGINVNFNHAYESDVKIDTYSPLLDKDLLTFPYALESVRRNVKHPIGKSYIISPNSEKIKKVCKEMNCEWINETDVSPVALNDIGYIVNGVNRNGWLLQQFVKLSADKFVNSDHIFWVDTDTIFLRPHVFEHNGKYIFDISDEYNPPYFKIYEKLFKQPAKLPVSFVAHHMIVQKAKLVEMNKKIEEVNGMEWYKAILHHLDRTSPVGFAEFETFGQYMYANYSDTMILEYWYNKMAKYGEIGANASSVKQYQADYKTLSYQHYYR